MKNFNIQSLGLVMMLIAMISTTPVPNDIVYHLKQILQSANETRQNASDKWKIEAPESSEALTCVKDTNHETKFLCLAANSLNHNTTTEVYKSTHNLRRQLGAYNNLMGITCHQKKKDGKNLKTFLKEIMDCVEYELQ